MSLQLVTGPAGSGKSHTVYEELIRNAAEHPERNFLVLVPEQFTMQVQADLARRSPVRGLMNVDVLSFQRLAWRVFGEVGGSGMPILDDTGKSLIVQKIISKKQGELGMLGRALGKRGAAEQMKSLIAEFLQYRVEPKDLDAWVDTVSDRTLLAGKLRDIQTVYRAFREYLADKYLTTEELLQVLSGVIGRSALLSESEVVLDGFTGFTPVQYEVIRELLLCCQRVTCVITADGEAALMSRPDPHRLFHMSAQTAQRLANLARETGAEILPVREIPFGPTSRHAANPELAFLERHLFRPGQQAYRPVAGERDTPSVFLAEGANPSEEILAAAEIIRKRVREEGLRYRDMAVVTGDLETYGRLAAQTFSAAGIPFFLDNKKPVWTNQVVEFLRAGLELLARRHSYGSVLRFLRCPLSGFTRDEVDRMENYILALGIRGRTQYESRWTRITRLIEAGELEDLNALRERFVSLTGDFVAGMREGRTVAQKTEALYSLLVCVQAQEACAGMEEQAKATGDAEREREYAQIYPRVVDLLDKLVDVLGDERISIADYQKLLEAGFAELRLGLIPPGEDQVLIGDIERTRLAHIKVLFFVGVNDGLIPRPVTDAGLLSEQDRELLKQKDVELAPTAREEIARQRFYLYLAMTKPSSALYLSYSAADEMGAARSPSYLVGSLRRLFPDKEVQLLARARGVEELLETPVGQEQILLDGFRGARSDARDGAFLELCRNMQATEEGREKLEQLFAAAEAENRKEELGASLAVELYGATLKNSVTRLEKFAACPFAHFAKYGLRLNEREHYEFSPADLGSLLHKALENFSEKVAKSGRDWAALSDAERERFAKESMEEIVHGFANAVLESSRRNAFLIGRLHRTLQKTVWALQQQLRKGSFTTAAVESSFSERQQTSTTLSLPEGMQMQLIGQIDRLDVCEADGKRYIKVIDYKTGNTKLNLNSLYEGLQLQLALYLHAAMEQEQATHPTGTVEPAGMLYYHIDDPMLKDVMAEEVEGKTLRALRPNGLVRQERDILYLFDRDLTEGMGSSVVPVKLKNDGEPDANSQTANGEAFSVIRAYADAKARELAGRIAQGEVAADPAVGKDIDACAWCPYRNLCGFDLRIPGCRFRRIQTRDDADLIALMRDALGIEIEEEET